MSKQVGNGIIFKNTYKKKANQPDYRGKLTVNEIEHDISGWWKRDKNDVPFLSLSVQEKQAEKSEDSTADTGQQLELFD